MGKEIFICYWIGEETYATLNTVPAYVDIVPLAFLGITKDYQLDFSGFSMDGSFVRGWINTLHDNKTKVLFSINSSMLGSITGAALSTFVKNVVGTMNSWGVDGLDFDYEPPNLDNGQGKNLVALVAEFRKALKPDAILTMPIYGAWLFPEGTATLKALEPHIDYFCTMDYTPYPGFGATTNMCSQYANAVTWGKLVIGMSCMGPYENSSITPYEDVVKLAQYEPGSDKTEDGETKAGAMLYTFNYDRRWRTSRTNQGVGTGYSNLAWTEAIHANLP